jgi:hypothetical protein
MMALFHEIVAAQGAGQPSENRGIGYPCDGSVALTRIS